MATPTIFISYRREDSAGQSGRIFDRLVQQFGKSHVYRDIDTITAGEDFVEAVREKINQSDILLALIGPKWLTAADEEGRWRLADENDLVRIEIATALERNMRVIPVLLQGAAIPKVKDLPGELARLAQRNAVEIRDTNFDLDTEQLIAKLGSSWRNKFIRTFARWPVYGVIALLLASPLGFWIYPQVALTPEKARIQIAQMGMQFDAETFVKKAEENDTLTVTLFLRAGMNPNDEIPWKNQTALKHAAKNGNLDLVKTLIDNGADIEEGMRCAANYHQRKILDWMLKKNPGQVAINSSLHAAVGTEATDIVRMLLDKGADINFVNESNDGFISISPNTSVLMEALSGRNPDIEEVRLLLSKGADVNLKVDNEEQPSALFVAATRNNADLVDLLLTHDADVNVKNKYESTPLHEAIANSRHDEDDEGKHQSLKIVQSLLDKGADFNSVGRLAQLPPLTLAITESSPPQIVLLLIERGANINAQSEYKVTALMAAINRGDIDIIKTLLVKGAEVNAQDKNGDSALLRPAPSRDKKNEILQLLLSNGADPRLVDNNGRNVLMKASDLEEDVIKRLIKSGAQVNAVDENGWTALMHAVKNDSTVRYYRNDKYIRKLLSLGADTTIKNKMGETALAIATQHNNKEMMYLLETHATNQRKNKKK